MISAIVLLTDPNSSAEVEKYFAKMGFETEQIIGGSLTISGKKQTFADSFSIDLTHNEEGQVRVMQNQVPTLTIPIENLSEPLRSRIQAIEFQAPVEFGPTDY